MRTLKIKKKLVESGNSRIFENWHSHAGVSKEDFLAGLEWLYEAEFPSGEDDGHKLRYELGCTENGELVKIKRTESVDGITAMYRMDDGTLWSGCLGPGISARDRI